MYQFKLQQERPELSLECAHFGHILALLVKTDNDCILVGDLLRSITVLRYKPSTSTSTPNGTLEEVARDFNVNSMRAVEFFHGTDQYLGSEDFGNIFIARRQIENVITSCGSGTAGSGPVLASASLEERGRLVVNTEFHIGDSVNVLRPGVLNVQPAENKSSEQDYNVDPTLNSNIQKKSPTNYDSILYGTINGSLGSIISIPEDVFNFLSVLESSIREVIPAVGGFSHAEYRSLHNGRRSGSQSNAIDGDLIETFVMLASENKKKVVLQMNNNLRSVRMKVSLNTGNGSHAAEMQNNILSGNVWRYDNNGVYGVGQTSDGYTVDSVIAEVEKMARLH